LFGWQNRVFTVLYIFPWGESLSNILLQTVYNTVLTLKIKLWTLWL
jgi:hypothetical protein